MKILPSHYAHLLLEIDEEKDVQKKQKSLEKLAHVLRRRRHVSFLYRIEDAFRKLHDEKHGIIRLRVCSARGVSEEIQDRIREIFLENDPHVKEVVFIQERDQKILGGVIIEMKGFRYDASLRRRLFQFGVYMRQS